MPLISVLLRRPGCGIAIAFAAQKTIENLFGTVTVITADRDIAAGGKLFGATGREDGARKRP
jgi:hypothetical protein